MLKAAFLWLDAHPEAYALGAGSVTFFLAWWVARELRRPGDRGSSDAVTALALLSGLLAWRWPYLLDPRPLNPDEAHLLTGAITLWQHPGRWAVLDSHTAGILDPLALLPLRGLGVPLDYFGARLSGLLMEWGVLLAGLAVLRSHCGRKTALVGLLPLLVFFCTTTDGDFIHCSTEHFPVLFFALTLQGLERARRALTASAAPPSVAWLGAGLALGLLPWAKLQATPLGLLLAGWGCGLAASTGSFPSANASPSCSGSPPPLSPPPPFSLACCSSAANSATPFNRTYSTTSTTWPSR